MRTICISHGGAWLLLPLIGGEGGQACGQGGEENLCVLGAKTKCGAQPAHPSRPPRPAMATTDGVGACAVQGGWCNTTSGEGAQIAKLVLWPAQARAHRAPNFEHLCLGAQPPRPKVASKLLST